MRVINNLFICFMLVLFTACKDEEKQIDDSEIRYRFFNLEKAGWKSREHTQRVDDIGFTATEVPIPYYILNELGSDDLFLVDSIEKANVDERILEFKFFQQNEKDLLDKTFTDIPYEEGVKYMSFHIDKDFYLVTSKKDTVKCSGVIFERTFKVTPYQKVILFFEGVSPDEKVQLVYEDRLFRKGTLKFKFEEKTTKLLL